MVAHTVRGNRPPSAPPLTRSVRSRPAGPGGDVVDRLQVRVLPTVVDGCPPPGTCACSYRCGFQAPRQAKIRAIDHRMPIRWTWGSRADNRPSAKLRVIVATRGPMTAPGAALAGRGPRGHRGRNWRLPHRRISDSGDRHCSLSPSTTARTRSPATTAFQARLLAGGPSVSKRRACCHSAAPASGPMAALISTPFRLRVCAV